MTDFTGTAYREHTQCISEAEKYQKSVYRPPKKNAKNVKNVAVEEECKKRKNDGEEESNNKKVKTVQQTQQKSTDLLGSIKATANDIINKKKKISIGKLIKKITKSLLQKDFSGKMSKASLKSTVESNLFLHLDSNNKLTLI